VAGGGPALTDMIGGQVQVYFGTAAATMEYIRTGKLRPLATTGATRAAVLPDIPALAEFLPGYEASIYVGIVAPRNTPTEIVSKLNQEINLGVADPRIALRIAELGDTALSLSPSGFGQLIAEETEKWAKLIRAANIRAE
jgi:tripartite-type tricarboxylate transporter receptor subunit TctC